MEWSYRLLEEHEWRVFRALSAFPVTGAASHLDPKAARTTVSNAAADTKGTGVVLSHF